MTTTNYKFLIQLDSNNQPTGKYFEFSGVSNVDFWSNLESQSKINNNTDLSNCGNIGNPVVSIYGNMYLLSSDVADLADKKIIRSLSGGDVSNLPQIVIDSTDLVIYCLYNS